MGLDLIDAGCPSRDLTEISIRLFLDDVGHFSFVHHFYHLRRKMSASLAEIRASIRRRPALKALPDTTGAHSPSTVKRKTRTGCVQPEINFWKFVVRDAMRPAIRGAVNGVPE